MAKKKKTHEEYVEGLKLVNPDIEVVGIYMGSDTKITHHCLKHDVYWDITPHNILSGGQGCELCRRDKIRIFHNKTHEDYIKEVDVISPHIIVKGRYVGAKTPILHECIIHNIEWETAPDNILHGHNCPECRKQKIRESRQKTHEQYVKELKNANPNVIVLEEYIDALTPILHKCLIDGNEWVARPANILFGYGCPECNVSHGERQVIQWLENNHIEYNSQYIFEDCKDVKPLPFDFYLPTHNIAIEYDGEQHYRPVEYFGGQEKFEYIVKHDNIKNEYCKNNGIVLLRIPYFKNVEEELNNFLFI